MSSVPRDASAAGPITRDAEVGAGDARPTVVIVGGGGIVSGREIMMIYLARGLRAAGWRVVFISSLWSGKGEFIARLAAEKFEYFRVRLGFISLSLSLKPIYWTFEQLRHWPALALGYRKAIKASAPRVVIHTNWHHALLLLPFLDRRRDIYWSHEIVPDRRHYRWVFGAIARNVARVVCVSQAVARSLEKVGVPSSKIEVVHNGVEFQVDIPPPRAQLPLRLGIVGQVAAWKGHDDVFEAVAQVPRGQVVVNVFGGSQDDYAQTLRAKAGRLQIGDAVSWRGYVADPADIYREIDVCLVVSRFADPFPTSALEAGLAGRPVICTPLGGLPEIVEDGVTGILVAPERPDLLAASINGLVARPDRVVAMGKAARERIAREFGYEKFVTRFRGVVDRVVARAP